MRRARRFTWLAGVLALASCEPGSRDARRAPDAKPEETRPSITSRPDETPSAWTITPGHVGSVSSRTSEADLIQQQEPSEVATVRIELGEGETAPGTVLFPDDTLRRAEIIWQDTVNRRQPARVIIRGSRTEWRLPFGITLGTTLQELERLNRAPFRLAGFGWDYAGVVIDWNGGALDSALAGIKLYLDPGPAAHQSAVYSRVLGDHDYASSLPPMQQLNPRVYQIFVDFAGHDRD